LVCLLKRSLARQQHQPQRLLQLLLEIYGDWYQCLSSGQTFNDSSLWFCSYRWRGTFSF
jgi:hypothetical protein